MKTIYKYPLEVRVCAIDLPENSKVVCVHEQNGVPTLWIEREKYGIDVDYKFAVVGTGDAIPEDGFYVGSCFIGSLVWHVYQRR